MTAILYLLTMKQSNALQDLGKYRAFCYAFEPDLHAKRLPISC